MLIECAPLRRSYWIQGWVFLPLWDAHRLPPPSETISPLIHLIISSSLISHPIKHSAIGHAIRYIISYLELYDLVTGVLPLYQPSPSKNNVSLSCAMPSEGRNFLEPVLNIAHRKRAFISALDLLHSAPPFLRRPPSPPPSLHVFLLLSPPAFLRSSPSPPHRRTRLYVTRVHIYKWIILTSSLAPRCCHCPRRCASRCPCSGRDLVNGHLGRMCRLAPRVSNEQHLSFRVVWPKCKPANTIQIPNQAKAREIVKKLAAFQCFLKHTADTKTSVLCRRLHPRAIAPTRYALNQHIYSAEILIIRQA